MPDIAPEFKEKLKNAFEQIQIGQQFTFRRTFTDGDVALFCGVTGDYNPYHIDESFAQETWFGRRIVPGLLTGSLLTHIGGLLGFLATEMHFYYLSPVYVGDTITCIVTIAEKDPIARRIHASATLFNQNNQEVLKANFSGFPSNIRLAN
jgi:acyl dehydratase